MAVTKRSILAWCVCVVTFLVFVAACLSPAIDLGPQIGGPELASPHGINSGARALFWGWTHLIVFIVKSASWSEKATSLTWFANPLALISLILLACRISAPATVLAGVAFALCVWFLAVPHGQPLIGAYLWVISVGLLFFGAAFVMVMGWCTRRVAF